LAPALSEGDRVLGRRDAGFLEGVSALVGQRLAGATSVPRQEIALRFERGAVFSISLREADFTGPEAAVLQLKDDKRPWIVWPCGD